MKLTIVRVILAVEILANESGMSPEEVVGYLIGSVLSEEEGGEILQAIRLGIIT